MGILKLRFCPNPNLQSQKQPSVQSNVMDTSQESSLTPQRQHLCSFITYPGIRKTSTAATVKVIRISMCGGRVSRSVKLSIGHFSQNLSYRDFLGMTFTTSTLHIFIRCLIYFFTIIIYYDIMYGRILIVLCCSI